MDKIKQNFSQVYLKRSPRDKNMKKLLIYLIASSFSLTTLGAVATNKNEKSESSRHEKICDFEHHLLSSLVHEPGGYFFAELESGLPELVTDEAMEMVDEEFSKLMKLKSYPKRKAYVIIFQEPAQASECYYAIIKKEKDGYSYYTLEKGEDFFGVGKQSFICKSTKNQTYSREEARKYTDLDSFVQEVIFKK